jgi:hypothetical protein
LRDAIRWSLPNRRSLKRVADDARPYRPVRAIPTREVGA